MKKITKTTWLDIFASPFVMALPITIVIILFLPDIFQKYIITQTFSGKCDKANSVEEYQDLDNDGYSERVVAFPNEMGHAAIKLLRNDGSIIDQWNFTGKYVASYNRFYCADLDKDSLMEIYVFTAQKDSLYIHAIDMLHNDSFIFKNKLISVIKKYKDSIDVSIGNIKTADLNNDGFNELVFIVNAGYSKQPRGVFAYNTHNDSIIRTPPMGAKLNSLLCIEMDKDNTPEIICGSNTSGNIQDSDSIPYSDYSSWLMGFDEKLEFLFPPIEYDAYQSGLKVAGIQSGGKSRVVAYSYNKNKSQKPPSMITLIDKNGRILRKRLLRQNNGKDEALSLIATMDYFGQPVIVMSSDNKSVILFDTLLNPVKTIKGFNLLRLRFREDLDLDGTDEFVFITDEYPVLIARAGLKDAVGINIDREPFSTIPYCVSIKQNGDKLPELFIKAENNAYFYTYQFNKFYYMKYPIWLGIYLVILVVILLIRYLQKIQLQHKMEIENQINALQLKTIKSQMDPHFMFNALNSISTSILNEQKETAYSYMVKFSSLLRSLFTKADDLAITLQEELSFVENYLELEKFRFKDRLSFEIQIEPNVNQSIQIPRMLIQLFVENAIKHGLRHKKGKGRIFIKAEQRNKQIYILIEDDGIGRKAAKEYKEGHGKGLRIINEMISLFENITKKKITYQYIDNKDSADTVNGTTVKIAIEH